MNWVEEIFEGFHVRERGDQPGLIWADMETGRERRFTYAELAANGNKCLNFMRKNGVGQGDSMYMMLPIIPETWFTTIASLKGGLVNVPTATSMTIRELRFRFEAYPPDCIVTSQAGVDLMDEALSTISTKPKVKIVIGQREGWTGYADLEQEPAQAEGAEIKNEEILFCFFTSGTTGLPKRVVNILAKFKIPRIIEFVNEVPKTISGKIRRIELREQEIKRKKAGKKRAKNEYFYWEFPELSSKKKK